MKQSTLKQFMPWQVRERLGNWPTTHRNCIEATQVRNEKGQITTLGIARPGKTARDRARQETRQK